MRTIYLFNIEDRRNYPICKRLENLGYKICGIEIDKELLDKNKRLNLILSQKIISEEEELELIKQLGNKVSDKITKYLSDKPVYKASEININENDKVFALNEFDLFESSFIDDTIISQKNALCYIAKHIYYKKLNINYNKVRSFKDLKTLSTSKTIIKPSICSMGKRNVHLIRSEQDKDILFKKYPNMFSNKRLFISMPYIEHTTEIWAFTVFDHTGKPYVLFYITANGHTTKSPFEEDVYAQIKNINKKLNITNWMACMQFLVLPNGDLYFIDLNPRLPADDNWYELAYRYLTGRSLSKLIIDLILYSKPPDIIKSDKIIVEDEYNPNYKIEKNQRVWLETDMYKNKPLLTFK